MSDNVDGGERRDGIQVVARVADILRHLSMEPDGLTPQELAARSGIPRPTIYRIGKALPAEDFVRIMPTGKLAIGPGLMGLAISSRRDIRHEVSPFLKKLSDDLDETADLAVLFAGEALHVDQYVSPHVLRVVAHIGGRLPLHCTANGKALPASLTPQQMDAVLPAKLRRFTPNTITDRRRLSAEVQRVRDTGLSFDIEEHAEGVVAVGAYVEDVMGDVVSLAAVVPMARHKRDEASVVAAVARTRDEAQAALLKSDRGLTSRRGGSPSLHPPRRLPRRFPPLASAANARSRRCDVPLDRRQCDPYECPSRDNAVRIANIRTADRRRRTALVRDVVAPVGGRGCRACPGTADRESGLAPAHGDGCGRGPTPRGQAWVLWVSTGAAACRRADCPGRRSLVATSSRSAPRPA